MSRDTMHSEQDLPARRVAFIARERDRVFQELAAERERVAALMQQLDALALENHQLRTGQAPARGPALLEERDRQLAYAQATIRNMERSWFWRARLMWVRLRTALGR